MLSTAFRGAQKGVVNATKRRAQHVATTTTARTPTTTTSTSRSQRSPCTPLTHTAQYSTRPASAFQATTTTTNTTTITPTTLRGLTTTQSNNNTSNTPHQSSLLLTALSGALISTLTYYILDRHSTTPLPKFLRDNPNATLTFDELETILSSANYLPEDILSGDIDLEKVREEALENQMNPASRYAFKEISMVDYAKIMAIPDESLPLPHKIDSLRTLLLQQLADTEPLLELLSTNIDTINSAVVERIYYQFIQEAKLLNLTHERPLSHEDLKQKMNWDTEGKMLTPEQVNGLQQLLYFARQNTLYDYPTIEQCHYLTDDEIKAAYQKLCGFCMNTAKRIPYYKLMVLNYDLENSIDFDPNTAHKEQQRLQDRLDTVVTATHNTAANAFTHTLDHMEAFDPMTKVMMYREKTLELVNRAAVDVDFFVESIAQINEVIMHEVKKTMYQHALREKKLEKRDALLAQYKAEGREVAEIDPELDIDDDEVEVNLEDLADQVAELFDQQKISAEQVIPLQRSYQDAWVRLTYCDPVLLRQMNPDELDQVLGGVREEYLKQKEREFIPLLYLTQYGIEKPIDYNPLYNKAFNALRGDVHPLMRPTAERLLSYYAYREKEIREEMMKQAKPLDLGTKEDSPYYEFDEV